MREVFLFFLTSPPRQGQIAYFEKNGGDKLSRITGDDSVTYYPPTNPASYIH
jgi:hypothetical protein